MNNKRDNIYENMTKSNILKIFSLGVVIGIVCFFVIYGIKPLNVCDDSWLLSGGDLSQHYFGWCFYRNSPWQYPIGMIDGLMYPDKICITYTDSIPLFAIIFKILSPILPKTFQYFGLWGIFSYMMLGGLSAVLIRKVTAKWYLCGIGAAFFVLSPYVLQRMFKHTSLAGQWIIVAAIVIIVYKPFFYNLKRQLTAWAVLLFVAAFTHIYFVPMVGIFMVGFCIEDILSNIDHFGKKLLKNIGLGVCACIPALLGLKILGSFEGTSSLVAEGLGEYSANLNALWNSQGHTVGKMLPVFKTLQKQYEGFGYLGAGIILLVVCLIIYKSIEFIMKKRNKFNMNKKMKKKNESEKCQKWIQKHALILAMSIISIIFIIFALSPTVTWGNKILFTVKYPGFIIKIWSIFRASGRFIWCVDYMVFAWILMEIVQIERKIWSFTFLIIGLMIQIYDLTPFMTMTHQWYKDLNSSEMILKDEQWIQWSNEYSHILFLPYAVCQAHQNWMFSLADYAKDYHMTLNYYVSARTDFSRLDALQQQVYEELANGEGRKDTLYIFMDEDSAKNSGLNIYNVDGLFVGIAN